MINAFAFLAGLFGAGLLMYLSVTTPHRIDSWLRVRRRIRDSHPPKARTTITAAPSAKAATKATANSHHDIISYKPFVMLNK